MSTIRRTIPLAVLVLVVADAAGAAAQPTKVRKEQPPSTASAASADSTTGLAGREIVVTATGHAHAVADRAMLSVLVEGTGDEAAWAAQRAEASLVNVSEAIRQLGGAATTLGVTPLGVIGTPNVSGFRHVPGRPAYRAGYVMRVQVAHPTDVPNVATTALAAGARTTPPAFESSTADSARLVSYTDALAQARREAEAIAGAMGARLGDVVGVSTADAPSADAPAVEGATLPSADVVVGTAVTVRYRVLPR